ncbi:DUF5343 domain-containing protein [Crateriforma conspicua]|uniref:DUF5343 domain-containing protein n=1 Tax=Crateriforma spongiae TaxID=2724528 RepID=UPI0011B75288
MAYPTFKNFIGHLKEHGTPSRIDKSVMSHLSGGTQSHLSSTLKFLSLIDEAQAPSSELHGLIAAHGTEQWAFALKEVLAASYSGIVESIDLRNATPSQLDKCFEDIGLKGVMLDKTVRFYLSALEDASVDVSPHFAKRKPKATRRSRPKARTSNTKSGETRNVESSVESDQGGQGIIEYPLHLSGGRKGLLRVPSNINADDCRMIELTLPLVQALAESNADA